MRWFVKGDIDGFFGLVIDNLVQLLVIVALCRDVLGFQDPLIYGRILPGIAISLLIGNIYYALQAKKIADDSGRTDICALPYGINTVSLFAFVFLVMLPAKLVAEANGAKDPAYIAWVAGLYACLGSGLIEFVGAFVAERLRKATPRAALLATLAGIAISFISLGFLFRTYANPIIGLSTLGIILLTYYGRIRFRGNIPGGLIAVLLGILLAWLLGMAPQGNLPETGLTLSLPTTVFADLFSPSATKFLLIYMAVIIPMGLFNVLGSLQNIESAEAAGDFFPTRASLSVNGIGTIAAALFGSCFPTTIYIGHPGWKAMGARIGYSVLNGLFMTFICLTGALAYLVWAVPIDAGMAIVLWIGIVISAQAFQVTPIRHAPAVALGLLPGIGAWGAVLAKQGMRVGGYGTPERPFNTDIFPAFQQQGTWINGAFALEQGFIFSSMILAALTVCLIERQFIRAAIWSWSAAALSMTGLMHSYRWTVSDTALSLTPAWSWATGYLLMGGVFLLARYLCVPDETR